MPTVLSVIILAIVISEVATLATTVYLHRTLSHRALTVRPPLAFAFRVITWLATGMKPRQWVAVHRKHHAFTDVEGDPHSPVLLGWVRVQLTNAALYRRVASDDEQVRRYARDLPPDRWDRIVFDHAFVGLGIGITILCLLLGPWWGLFAAAFHTVFYLMTNGAVNAIGHRFGKKPYDNEATNLQWLAWLTLGEGLHNNHHAAPTSARLSLKKGEFDPGWWFIVVARKLGLAHVRLDKVVLKPRMEAVSSAR
jgi:stearoyl-CoA desaturase (delta-9 desaturase)